MDLVTLQLYLNQKLNSLGFELIHLEAIGSGENATLCIYIDYIFDQHNRYKDTATITIDDCVLVNNHLVECLDLEFIKIREQYNLEISSPGLDRPLTKLQHFLRFMGHNCRVQTITPISGQRNFKGIIHSVTDKSIVIKEDNFLKTITLDNIKKARLVA